MTTFDVINVPHRLGADDPESSFDGLETMEARMEAHLLTITTLISERESAWEEFESLDMRFGRGSVGKAEGSACKTEKIFFLS